MLFPLMPCYFCYLVHQSAGSTLAKFYSAYHAAAAQTTDPFPSVYILKLFIAIKCQALTPVIT